jgi:MFS family permease
MLTEPEPKTEPAPPPAQEMGPPQKIWAVGTLTYTTSGLVFLFVWLLLGDFAWSMRDRSVGPMSSWYLDHLKVPSLVFGLLISSFPALIGVILGPYISVKSDRHRGRWGRRIPFLLITTPMAAAGMIGLAFTPILSAGLTSHFPEAGPLIPALVCFGVFWTLFEIATIASQAVFGGLINDVVPHELLGRFYGLFRAVSLIDGMIFNYWILGKVPAHFTLILAVIGVFYGTAFFWVCLKVKEGNYPPPPPLPESPRGDRFRKLAGIRAYFRETFSNPYYVWVFVMTTASGLCFAPVNTFSIPFARSLAVDMDLYGKCLALTFAISLLLSYPLGWLADLVHPLRMAIGTVAGYVAVTIFGWFFAHTPQAFLVAWVLHGVLSGCYYTSAASLGQRLFPKSKFAQFASAAGILGAPASMALAPLVGSLIDVSGKVYRHTFAVGAVLGVLALVAGVVVYSRFTRLGGPRHYVAP